MYVCVCVRARARACVSLCGCVHARECLCAFFSHTPLRTPKISVVINTDRGEEEEDEEDICFDF